MHVLVIGGTGFIGRHVVRCLMEDCQVSAFHRGETQGALPQEVQHIYGDRKRLHDYRDALQRLAPQVVLDLIAYTEDEARALVDVLRGVARRAVVVSSQDVYRAYDRFRKADPGPPDPVPLDEDAPLRDALYPYRAYVDGPDDWLYHYDKILVEQVVRHEPTLAATVLRLPQVYGPGDKQHRLFPHVKRMDDLPSWWKTARPLGVGPVAMSQTWPLPLRWPCVTTAPPAASTTSASQPPSPNAPGCNA